MERNVTSKLISDNIDFSLESVLKVKLCLTNSFTGGPGNFSSWFI